MNLTPEQRLVIITRILEKAGKRALRRKVLTKEALTTRDVERIFQLAAANGS